ncbi:hypothetical protein CKM354_001116200 [Cercospora kikuchii]|uniref:Major facilitator superfamily (MFS) profile domain-containing protein n=1 Tax=Cercospora kikuchii TaxID=84275 RepID=A0A9P3FKX8_9PEZI|nr:uncharacterized protein CKM354_001116200 [Cercospora kikuchii]GIZ48089.1 hypothetical protein CKM354_001116200 [Cercospora kikuchii]
MSEQAASQDGTRFPDPHSDSSKTSSDIEVKATSPDASLAPLEAEEECPRSVHGVRWVVVCCSLYLEALIYGLDTTIAADIQAAVIDSFGSIEKLTWIGTAFPLGSVCAILPTSALYSTFDLKYIYVGSIVLFEAGSALCGAALTLDALIVGRALAGLGGSGIFLGTLNFFSLCTTQQERGKYIAGIGVVWGSGAVLGPVVGGAFSVSSATWRWAFYINLVIAAVCAPAYLFYMPSVTPPGAPITSIWSRTKALDWIGFTTFTGAIVCFTMALTFGGATWAWGSDATIAMFVVSGVLAIGMVLQQGFVLFTTREARQFPPRHILSDWTLILLNIVTAMAAVNIYVPLYYIPVYFAFVHGDSAIVAAVRLLPYIVFLAGMNMASGALLSRIKYYWALYVAGGVLMTVGGATMFTVTPEVAKANIYGYSIILGAGTGLIFNAGYTVCGVKTMIRTGSGLDVQRAISMINLSQLGFQMGSLLIGGQIFQSYARANLARALDSQDFSGAQISSIIAGAHSALFESLSDELKHAAVSAITSAIGRVYIFSIVAGAVTVICAAVMKKETLFPPAAPKMVIAGGA